MANVSVKQNGTKVTTNKVRLSYPHLFEKNAVEGGKAKYSASLIIDKENAELIKAINAAVEEAIKEGESKLKNKAGNIPKNLKKPLRDGDIDREDDEAYENAFFLNANTDRKPQCVDQRVQPITDPDDLYAGCYVRASVNFYAFNTNGNLGIAVGLNNIQKVAEGEALSGGSTAAEDFEAVETDVDDIMDDENDLL